MGTLSGVVTHSAASPQQYPLIGESLAGDASTLSLTRETVAYVTTGAPMPPGSDAAVKVPQRVPARAHACLLCAPHDSGAHIAWLVRQVEDTVAVLDSDGT